MASKPSAGAGVNTRPLILDGGMGTQLKTLGAFVSEREYQTLWSAAPLLNGRAHAIQLAHEDFIRAGADVITTNTYACTREILAKANAEGRQQELLHDACKLAIQATRSKAARDAAMLGRRIMIAGALPPLSVSYRSDLVGDKATMREEYLQIASVLAQHADVLLCETMSSIDEARASAEASRCYDRPVWISVCVGKYDEKDASKVTVRSGESIEAFVHALAPLADALLVNCSTPEDTTVAVKCIRDALEAHHVGAGAPHRRPISIGAYGNRMEPVEEDWVLDTDRVGDGLLRRRADVTATSFAASACEWASSGCSIVGGCCGISPADIAQIALMLRGGLHVPERGLAERLAPRRLAPPPHMPKRDEQPGNFALSKCACLSCHEPQATVTSRRRLSKL